MEESPKSIENKIKLKDKPSIFWGKNNAGQATSAYLYHNNVNEDKKKKVGNKHLYIYPNRDVTQ